jgi:concanavalin A-like lectin/glucanase superfamily protein
MWRAVLLLLAALALSGCGVSSVASTATPPAPKSYSATILADRPAAYWRMDETSGTIMADATGNGNSGEFAGTYTLGQPGGITAGGSTAVAFDGQTGGASAPSSASLQVNTVTIELWIKKRAETEYGVYVAKNVAAGDGPGSGWFQLLNSHHDGRLQFRVTSDLDPALVSTSTLAPNTWYYVAATYDGTVAKLFVNGKLDASLEVTATPKQTADPVFIGHRPDGLFNDAVLDEVAIYPTALAADRIAAHWRAASASR